jgi:hypothetical protein
MLGMRKLLMKRVVQLVWHSPDFRRELDDLIRLRVDEGILRHKAKLNAERQPGLGFLWDELKDIDLIRGNIKQLGLQTARMLYQQGQMAVGEHDRSLPLTSRLCRQADFAEPWFRGWCDALHLGPLVHRKIWEYAFVLQAMKEAGALRAGACGVGFGCGKEPIASFLASRGIDVTVTDLAPEQSQGLGWISTGQHTGCLQHAFFADLIGQEEFDRRVRLEFVDMNAIPASMNDGYDFCWSICALEHLGSIRKGLDFIKNSMRVLRSGGVAVHTTEFNLTNGDTVDNWLTVLFQQQHFVLLAEELKAEGYEMLPLDPNPGDAFLDKCVDLPPYEVDVVLRQEQPSLLKLSIDGFPATCVGIIVRKP